VDRTIIPPKTSHPAHHNPIRFHKTTNARTLPLQANSAADLESIKANYANNVAEEKAAVERDYHLELQLLSERQKTRQEHERLKNELASSQVCI
jgi:hypothetical protein